MIRYPILCLLVVMASLLTAQSTERYIRVIGNASQEVSASGASLVVTISEVKANDYRDIAARSIEENKESLLSKLQSIGYSSKSINEVLPTGTRNSRGKNRQYSLTLNSVADLEKVVRLTQEGITFGNVKYDFKLTSELSQQLSISAIQDAKRKAKAIASASDLVAGKILNIEDKPLSLPSMRAKEAKDNVTVEHRVAVTFDLKD
ncbi:MAG: SIMPL domain-containing protein [Saprospiraceae bacterium]